MQMRMHAVSVATNRVESIMVLCAAMAVRASSNEAFGSMSCTHALVSRYTLVTYLLTC